MNRKIISIIAAGGLSLMAGAAFAQSSSAQQEPQQTPPPATTQGGMNSGMNSGMNESGMSNSAGASNAAPLPFSSLDTQGNGYLTQQDASQNSWLGTHWAQCDADHDGKVTRTEYDACSQQ
jgi:hypothetical protein